MEDSGRYILDEEAVAQATRVERLRVFNERSIVGAVSAFAGIGLLGWVIGISAGWARALAWAVVMTLVEVAIILAGLWCRRGLATERGCPHCLHAHTLLVAVAGLAWGTSVWYVWTPEGHLGYLATMTILVGVAGVSMVTMASYARVTLLFFGGIYLAPLAHVLIYGDPQAAFLMVALVVGFVVQVGYTRALGKVVLRDAAHKARNDAMVERLHDLLIHDPLTGAFSRRYTFEQLDQLVSNHQRHGFSASIIMFDLDHFKRVNDTYGHPTGDSALREAVKAVSAQLRDGDVLGRIGGEEFLALLPMADRASALGLAERLRQTLEATTIVTSAGPLALPASFGVAEIRATDGPSEWFRRVDEALYRAKEQGRNRVEAST